MKSKIPSDSWLFRINHFDFPSTFPAIAIQPDRDFTSNNLRDLIQNSNRNHEQLGLFLTCPMQNILCPRNDKECENHRDQIIRNYLNHLIAEAHMMSALIPKTRKVTYLHCQADIAHNLDAAELTELMYVLSKLFNMRHQNANRFVIEIDRFPEHDAEIALLNGLGFSHIGMRFNAPGEQLEHYVSLARSYGMRIIFDLDTLTADTDCHKKLSLLLNQGVDAFCYRSDSQASKEMLPALEQAGIHSASPMFSCPPAFQEPRAPDILGLGMGALTVIGNCIAYNADQIDQYYQQIELHKLPLQHAGYARTLRQHS